MLHPLLLAGLVAIGVAATAMASAVAQPFTERAAAGAIGHAYALSDELDEEEEINQQADIPYTVYPCPVPAAPYPARAIALRLVEQRVPACRRQADALRLSFEARRRLMQQCLRRPGL